MPAKKKGPVAGKVNFDIREDIQKKKSETTYEFVQSCLISSQNQQQLSHWSGCAAGVR